MAHAITTHMQVNVRHATLTPDPALPGRVGITCRGEGEWGGVHFVGLSWDDLAEFFAQGSAFVAEHRNLPAPDAPTLGQDAKEVA